MARRRIFVFGSNRAGRHGAGSALAARKHWGASRGQGEGFQGDSYAIPTKDEKLNTLSLDQIKEGVERFLQFAREHADWDFEVVKIGTGLARLHGADEEKVAQMFADAPMNVFLHVDWLQLIAKGASDDRDAKGRATSLEGVHPAGDEC